MTPASERLLADLSPFARAGLLDALKRRARLRAEALPDELLPPVFLLSSVAKEWNEPVPVDDPEQLRARLEKMRDEVNGLAGKLLSGSRLSAHVPKYPPIATMNCCPGEIRIEYLAVGSRFRSGARSGILTGKTSCRALVRWEGAAKRVEYTDRRTNATVSFETSGEKDSSVQLQAPVVPIYDAVAPDEKEWLENAYRELIGERQ